MILSRESARSIQVRRHLLGGRYAFQGGRQKFSFFRRSKRGGYSEDLIQVRRARQRFGRQRGRPGSIFSAWRRPFGLTDTVYAEQFSTSGGITTDRPASKEIEILSEPERPLRSRRWPGVWIQTARGNLSGPALDFFREGYTTYLDYRAQKSQWEMEQDLRRRAFERADAEAAAQAATARAGGLDWGKLLPGFALGGIVLFAVTTKRNVPRRRKRPRRRRR